VFHLIDVGRLKRVPMLDELRFFCFFFLSPMTLGRVNNVYIMINDFSVIGAFWAIL